MCISIVLKTSQKSVQLLVRVIDDNILSSDALVEVFLMDLELSRGLSNTTTVVGVFGVATIRLGFTVTCTENYYGDACDVFCVRRNDTTGHYSCSAVSYTHLTLPTIYSV